MKPFNFYQSTTGSSHNTDGSDGESRRLAAFPYRGGKFHLAPKLVKLLPSHRIFVEVFGGAANVLLTKPPSPIEVYNDRDGALVNLFETVRNHPLLFLERCSFLLYSRELFSKWSRELDTSFGGADIDKVEAAVRTYYSIISGFVGDPTKGWAFARTGSQGGANRWASIWERVALLSQRLRHVNIDCLDFRVCVKNWDTEQTLFFLDPPYHNVASQGFYGHGFTWIDHRDLANLLLQIKGKFMLTYDDSSELLELYRGPGRKIWIRPITSTLASQKVPSGAKRVSLRQVLITNFPIEAKNNA